MSYLFWSHIIIWVSLFVYVFSLITKSKNLKRELEAFNVSKRDDT